MVGQTVGQRVASYRILAELGSGGMGLVYLAEVTARTGELAPGERVALKFLHPPLLAVPGIPARFAREAELNLKVRHPNVVRMHRVEEIPAPGRRDLCVVMELVEGQT